MEFFIDLFIKIVTSLINIAIIVIPLMVVIEILKDLKIIEKIASIAKPATNFFTMNEKSATSLIVGIFIGLLYGAGVIIQSVKDENLDKRSVLLVCIFLSLCHAVVEDTLLFKAVNAKLLPIVIFRLISAIIMTLIFSRVVKKENNNLTS